MTIKPPPEGDGDGSGGGGGGINYSANQVNFFPADQTVANAGDLATLVVVWTGPSGNTTATINNGVGLVGTIARGLVGRVEVPVHPTATTTYTVTVHDALNTGLYPDVTAQVRVVVGGFATAVRRYLDVRWSYTEPNPVGSCLGFEVLFFTGGNPANTDNWLALPDQIPATDRRYVKELSLVPPVSVWSAVRALYNGDTTSPWTMIGASVAFQ